MPGNPKATTYQVKFIKAANAIIDIITTIPPINSFDQAIINPIVRLKGKKKNPSHSIAVSFDGSSPSPKIKSKTNDILRILQKRAIVFKASTTVMFLSILKFTNLPTEFFIQRRFHIWWNKITYVTVEAGKIPYY